VRPPEEMLYEVLLPNLRGVLAHRLRSLGYPQSKIARTLNVTQPSVSGYLSAKESRFVEDLLKLGIPREDLEALIDSLVRSAELGPTKMTETLVTAWRQLLSSGKLCGYHRSMYPELADCDVCVRLGSSVDPERASVLQRLERAVQMLESSPIAHHLVPEVSTNVAESAREPRELNDVAAVPGRIVRVGGALRAVGRPSFGTSKHLASLLLKAKRNGISWSAVVNIRFDEDVLRALRETGMKYAVTRYPAGSPRSEEEVVETVVEALRRDPGIEVVLDAGGPGLEPAAYVFGNDSVDAVNRVLKIARAYVAVRGS
jgi:predicted fused transcriptional regulator/phosphomethylpyrimidine kinase/predicted transcriptional regulator